MNSVRVQLREWETVRPESGSPLMGLSLGAGESHRRVAKELTSSKKLEVLELALGLELRASSWVGRLVLGDVTITVQPKITGAPLLNLLRYAYGLRDLNLFGAANYAAEDWSFQDLIVQQLAAEAAELIARGLHRDYRHTTEDLASPKGRIDFQSYVRLAAGSQATLPCVHHPRTEATLLNQVLLSGLHLAAGSTTDLEMRARLRRLAQMLDPGVYPLRLDQSTLQRCRRSMDRRTASYEPALTLIELLVQSMGISLSDAHAQLPLPGFLFDMNSFFQALLSRFLHEHLEGHTIRDEYRLRGMFTYDPAHNPRGRRAPMPRPDFVVLRDNRVKAVLDAKYRDLWAHNLPSSMLYQLALYALSQNGSECRSTILYPTLDAAADDQIVVLQEPIHGKTKARVVLRPVNLVELEKLLRAPYEPEIGRKRKALARLFAFGER